MISPWIGEILPHVIIKFCGSRDSEWDSGVFCGLLHGELETLRLCGGYRQVCPRMTVDCHQRRGTLLREPTSLSKARPCWKFGLTPLLSLRAKAHTCNVITENAFKLSHANFPTCINCWHTMFENYPGAYFGDLQCYKGRKCKFPDNWELIGCCR